MRALGSAVNNDYDLDNSGSGGIVYNATPDASNPRLVGFDIAVGDGAKDLDGSGGDFILELYVGGVLFDGATQTKSVDSGITRLRFQTVPLLVPANAAVTVVVISPNASDSDVDVTVQPYDLFPLAVDSSGNGAANVTQFGGTNGTFDSGRPEVNATRINGNATAAARLALSAQAIYAGTVAVDSSSTQIYDAGLTSGEDNNYVGRILLFTTGDLTGQARLITAFDADENFLTIQATTSEPGVSDQYLIL